MTIVTVIVPYQYKKPVFLQYDFPDMPYCPFI